jgi:hypothetical protein
VACIALALVGIPLGIATRKGGKSAGYVIALFLSFFCYHLSSLTLIGFAKQRALLRASRGVAALMPHSFWPASSFSTAWSGPETATCWAASPLAWPA